MFAKLEISGTIEIVSGLHIGASDAFAAIGAIDSPVIRDPESLLPIIPGSSLKGKIRSLLAKSHPAPGVLGKTANEDCEEIRRLFGCSTKNDIHNSRLIFSDLLLKNPEELQRYGIQNQTEAKFENTINRMTSEANPRQIERVVRGAKFPLSIIYNVEKMAEMEEDMSLLKEGMLLLTYDYLGGNGSRGYGKIKFRDIGVKVVVGEVDSETVDRCSVIFKEL